MHPVPAEPAPLWLAAGQSLLIEVAAGHEVLCLDGRLALSGAPRLLGDALASTGWLLLPGQAWRADRTQWLTLHGPARLLYTASGAEPARKNRLVAAAARRWHELLKAMLRRAPRAVSARTP